MVHTRYIDVYKHYSYTQYIIKYLFFFLYFIQESSTNVVVVQQQPSTVYTTTVRPVGDNFLTLAVVLTILCCLCGTWYSLLCTIPAIIFAVNVSMLLFNIT